MANALGLPEHVMKQACVLLKTAQDDDLLPGRSIEGFATAALYAAARLNKTPRPIGDSFTSQKSTTTGSRTPTASSTVNSHSLSPPSRPIEYLLQLVSTVDAPLSVERDALDSRFCKRCPGRRSERSRRRNSKRNWLIKGGTRR